MIFGNLWGQENLRINANGKFFLNTDSQIGSSDLVLKSVNPMSWGGMYVDSPDDFQGRPFYGYATNGQARVYHYFERGSNTWRLYNAGDRLNINSTGQIGIGSTTPPMSAILDIQAANQGVLFPRMTTTNRTNIGSLVQGLMVFDTTDSRLYTYNGAEWEKMGKSLWDDANIYSGIKYGDGAVTIGTTPDIFNRFVVDAGSDFATAAKIDNQYAGPFNKYGLRILIDENGTGVRYGMHTTTKANPSDPSDSYSIYGKVDLNGSAGDVYGVYGVTVGTGSGVSYGVLGSAADQGYGIYGRAASGTAEAGYFDGKVTIDGAGQNDAALELRKNGADASFTTNGILQLGAESSTNIVFDDNEILSRNNGMEAPLYMQRDSGDVLLCALENGQVGIGLTSSSTMPSDDYLLAVDGKILCEEMRVELSGSWPDYVFTDAHFLPTLDQLKIYIDKNRHLPGIQPADEIENEGFDLGEMQRKMMEKIEELTLYVIQLHEQNLHLEQVIQEMKRNHHPQNESK
jgi:hypothetical protein